MPSVSDKQRSAMEAAAHGHSTLGIPKKVGQEFVSADKDATASGVHVPTAIGNDSAPPPKKKKPAKKAPKESEPFEITVDVDKASINDDLQIVYGWASVTDEGGSNVTDLQGDCIDIGEISKAAHDFMSASRVAGDSHQFLGVGQVVESVVFTPELQKALGIDLGKAGWFIGMHINDTSVWKRVKSGELGAFSIGGRAEREMMKAEKRSFYLVRHGHTSMNNTSDASADMIRGWTDVPLNEEGRMEAKKLAKRLDNSGVDCIYCSDLKRASETAKIIADQIGAEVKPMRGLRPWNLGKFAGKSTKDVLPEIADFAQNRPDEKVPEGESFNSFKARAFKGINDAIGYDPEEIMAVVTHHRIERLIKAWIKEGTPADHSIDFTTFLAKGEPPANSEIVRLPI